MLVQHGWSARCHSSNVFQPGTCMDCLIVHERYHDDLNLFIYSLHLMQYCSPNCTPFLWHSAQTFGAFVSTGDSSLSSSSSSFSLELTRKGVLGRPEPLTRHGVPGWPVKVLIGGIKSLSDAAMRDMLSENVTHFFNFILSSVAFAANELLSDWLLCLKKLSEGASWDPRGVWFGYIVTFSNLDLRSLTLVSSESSTVSCWLVFGRCFHAGFWKSETKMISIFTVKLRNI